MYFWFSEFEIGVNDSIFSNNEQQKVYKLLPAKVAEMSSLPVVKRDEVVRVKKFSRFYT